MVDFKAAYGWEDFLKDFRMQILFSSATSTDTLFFFPQVTMYLGCPCTTFLGRFGKKLANNLEILILSQFRPHHILPHKGSTF